MAKVFIFTFKEQLQYARSQIHCTNMHMHLSIVSDCHDVIKNLGRKVAQVFYNGLSRCLIVKPNGQGDSERICYLPYWLERQFTFQFGFTTFVRFLFQKLCQNSLWGFPTGSSSCYYFSFILLLYCPQTEHNISANMATMQINKMDQISPYEFSKFKPCSPYSSYNVHVIAFLVIS